MHRVIYVCGAIALALIITWVCFTFAGWGHHPKPPAVIEHVNPPVEQPLPPCTSLYAPPCWPMPEPAPPAPAPIPGPPPATVEPPQVAPPSIVAPEVVRPVKPHVRPHRKFPAKPKHVAPKVVPAQPVRPFCFFEDFLTGECFS